MTNIKHVISFKCYLIVR